ALLATSGRRPPPLLPAGPAELEGLVIAEEGDGVLLEVAEARSGDAPLPVARARASIEGEVGEEVSVRGVLAPVVPFRNESPHPSFDVARSTVRVREPELLSRHEGHGWRVALALARDHVRRALRESLADDVEDLVAALVLGDARLAEDDAAAARGAGLSHVIAVSGMHVTLVVGAIVAALEGLFRRVSWLARRGDPRRLAWRLGAAIAPFYALFAGGSASAWRAAATASLTWWLAASGRRADPLSVTAAVVIGACVAVPDAVASPAFVLSTLATAAVLERRDPTLGEASRLELLRALARASVRASIATAPFTLWCFGTLPALAIVANLVVVPLVAAVLLPLGTAHALLASVAPSVAPLTAGPTELVVRAFLALSSFFADAGRAWTLPPLDLAELVVVALACGGLLLLQGARARLVVAVGAMLALALAEGSLHAREHVRGALRITFLDVGQGDAALVDLPDGQSWLIDTGGAGFGSQRDPGLEAIVPVLAARRRSALELVVITHPHPDHYGGFAGLASRVPIHELWDSGQAAEETPEGAWARRHAGLLVPVNTPETLCGRPRAHAGAELEVISPCPRFDPGYEPNDNSLVVRIRFGRRTFLLLGDAEAHEEAALSSRLGHVDVVKVGHHGSRTSSTPALVARTQPWLAVVSAGAGNRYGHPHPEVIERWEAGATHVARTDRDGSVTVWTDGDRLEATTWSGRRIEAAVGVGAREALLAR
ncbi:MAG: ComEC/Rec2 family competence protein, partial [Sandaracinaceae bacterium]|nr:ComEC/Rec2 family competence protein [Sandaracinaceae bacterium]